MAACLSMAIFCIQTLFAQYSGLGYREKTFQLSLFPGISTNGLSSGLYYNRFSINLTSGLSAGNRYFELAGISNSHTRSSTGIQLSGLANIVGANSYIHMTYEEQLNWVREGDQSDMTGIQLAGLLNFVRNDAKGFQLTGGFNVDYGKAVATQFAGIGNTVNQNFQGIQIGGLYNYVGQGAGGLQIASLYNQAKNEIVGFQIGSINRSRRLGGKNSVQRTSARGRQIGLINMSKTNDGVQVGLINFAGAFHGTQIGLINFFKPGPYQGGNGRLGIPIGLLNLGSFQNHRLYTDELFIVNLQISTGSCYNCTWTESRMPLDGNFMIIHQNALVYGYNYWDVFDEFQWTIGYGFERLHFNKSSMSQYDPNNKKYFFSYGLRFQHLNKGREFSKELSFLTRGQFEVGYRLFGVYLFSGFTINNYLSRSITFERGVRLASGSLGEVNQTAWLGYQVGVQIR